VNIKGVANNLVAMKRVVLLLLIFTIFISVVPPVQAAGTSDSTSGIQIFPADYVWNVPIDKLPKDSRSDIYINSLRGDILRAEFGSGGFPINVVDNSAETYNFKTFAYDSVSDHGLYPIPDDPLLEGNYAPETCQGDCHMFVINRDTNYLYELFKVKKYSDGTWTARSGAIYDLSSNALRPNMWGSADAAGTPMVAGLIKYEEVATGEINHAIRVAFPYTNNSKVWPAIAYTSQYTNGVYPPMGQRFRLKASFDTSEYPTQTRVILNALKKYGMIVADNGGAGCNMAIAGTPDSRWSNYALTALNDVVATDFEAVDSSSLMISSTSGQARISSNSIQSLTNSPSITVTSPNGGESWDRSISQTLTWSYTGNPGSTVKIVLLKGAATIGTIADNVPIGSSGKGSYVWPGWTGRVPGSDYKVSVQSTSQPTIKDISNNFFTVTAGSTTPSSITVTSPNGGESWDRSISQTLTWSYTGNPGSTVKIVLLKGGSEIGTIASSVPIGTSGKGSYVWPGWTGRVPGSDYKVSVQSTSQPTIKDISNNFFTVTAGTTISSTTTPSITVTSANGGEVWYKNTNHAVTWSYTGNPGSAVKIVLLKGGTAVRTIAESVPIGSGGKGSYSWSVLPTLTSGKDYKFSVQSTSQTTIKDISNANFIICWL
jgi:hypothetical protein